MKMKKKETSWFARSERVGRAIEVIENGFESWIAVLYDDGSVESLPLNNSTGGTHGKVNGIGKFLKPSKKKSITLCLPPVAGVTNIKQHIFVFNEELPDDSKERGFHLCIVAGMRIIFLTESELVGVTSSKGNIFKKTGTIANTFSCHEIIVAIGQHDFIRRQVIDSAKRQFYHVRITFCLSSRSQRSITFCSHSRLISNECLQRAKASSYVIFFASIILGYLTFHAAKIRISK